MKTKVLLYALIVTILSIFPLRSQTIEDALRLSQSNSIITARAGALGAAYHGILDDFSAISYNPAGLALIDKGEMSIGLGFQRNRAQTEYYDNTIERSENEPYISNFGVVSPFQTGLGAATIAIGYYHESDYDNSIDFGGFNPNSTYTKYDADMFGQDGYAWNLWLADDSDNCWTPVNDSLYQSGMIEESGGLHNVSGALSFELSKFLTVGVSIAGKWGSYSYIRNFKEQDVDNLYTTEDRIIVIDDSTGEEQSLPVDLDYVSVKEQYEQSISGVTGSFGLLMKFPDFFRFGFSVTLPTAYDITEDFSQDASSKFDNEDKFNTSYSGDNTYSFFSPWIFSAGMSFHFAGFTLSSGIEFNDVTQMEFTEAVSSLSDLNLIIARDLQGQFKWGVGAEYEIPLIPAAIRASYNEVSSPYAAENVPEKSLKTIGLGCGFYLAPNIRMDALFRWSDFQDMWHLYGSGNYDSEMYINDKPLDFGLQITYRY